MKGVNDVLVEMVLRLPQRNSEAGAKAEVAGSLEKRWELEGRSGGCWGDREVGGGHRGWGVCGTRSVPTLKQSLCREWQ